MTMTGAERVRALRERRRRGLRKLSERSTRREIALRGYEGAASSDRTLQAEAVSGGRREHRGAPPMRADVLLARALSRGGARTLVCPPPGRQSLSTTPAGRLKICSSRAKPSAHTSTYFHSLAGPEPELEIAVAQAPWAARAFSPAVHPAPFPAPYRRLPAGTTPARPCPTAGCLGHIRQSPVDELIVFPTEHPFGCGRLFAKPSCAAP